MWLLTFKYQYAHTPMDNTIGVFVFDYYLWEVCDILYSLSIRSMCND